MKNASGYPLPSGELGDDNIVCQLVYLPDRPEYWQAFYAALHYMTTWRAWERDNDKRGKDAAANWRAAFELTSECWRMACLEQLQDDVAAILAIMEMPRECCAETDITDGDRYTDRVEDGEGDVPQNIIDAGYAEDSADWDGFLDYKCMIVHVTVDQLEYRLRELAPIVNIYGAVFGGLASLAAIVSVIFSGGGTALVFGLFAATGAVALLYETLIEGDLLVVLADKVATNHDELACATYVSDGDEGALIALNDKIDELFTSVEALILKNMNLGPTLKSLYAGRYDQQNIAEILSDADYDVLDFNCTCPDQVGEYLETYTWPDVDDWKTWVHNTGDYIGVGNPDYALQIRYGGPLGFARLTMANLALRAGISNPSNRQYGIRRIRFDYKHSYDYMLDLRLGMNYDGVSPYQHTNFPAELDWTPEEKSWLPGYFLCTYLGVIQFQIAIGGGGANCHIDNVEIDFDTWLQ